MNLSLFVILCMGVAISQQYVPSDLRVVQYASKDFLQKQKFLLEILRNVHQPLQYEEYLPHSSFYILDETKYTDFRKVKHFFETYENGMLPRGRAFSIFNKKQFKEAQSLFEFFYNSNDWETFYKNVIWARQHINEDMFVYALSVSVIHRDDLRGIVLPAPYEVNPFYFFNTETIREGQQYKMQHLPKEGFMYTYIIPSNVTNYNYQRNEHQILSYFTEDIGLNSYYYWFSIDYPFWMGGEEYGLVKDRRGEQYIYMYQQLLARYYLERLSNNLGEIDQFSFYKPIESGFYPNLQYYNGINFPPRPKYFEVTKTKNFEIISKLENCQRRLSDMIDSGFITLKNHSTIDIRAPEAIDYLGRIINSNPDSPNSRYYKHIEIIGRLLLGGSYQYKTKDHKYEPSALEQYETSMRDPMFYQFYKQIIQYWYQFKDHLPQYQKKDLELPGFKIESVNVGKMVTYFDNFDSDISNAIDVNIDAIHTDKSGKYNEAKTWSNLILARQKRINHQPFTFSLTVHSEKATKVIVRAYLGPKYDQYGHTVPIDENRKNFIEIDQFIAEIPVGKSYIKKNSKDSYFNANDRTTYSEIYKNVLEAMDGTQKFSIDNNEAHCGWPDRLLLPKGKPEGMTFQLFFIINEYQEAKVPQYSTYDYSLSCGVGSGSRFADDLPFGYPFDRHIDEKQFYTSNMYFKDVLIYHRE